MKRIQAFPFKALQQNLGIGRGSNVTLPPYLKSIRVYFGSETCPSMGPFSSFYVNELPRLFASNPDLVVSLDQEGDNGGSGHCSITLSPGNLQSDRNSYGSDWIVVLSPRCKTLSILLALVDQDADCEQPEELTEDAAIALHCICQVGCVWLMQITIPDLGLDYKELGFVFAVDPRTSETELHLNLFKTTLGGQFTTKYLPFVVPQGHDPLLLIPLPNIPESFLFVT
ncbi:hypothetical protein HDU91_005865, partial [Kappamyces sp. JEL0680]